MIFQQGARTRELATVALAKIEAHEDRCTERWTEVKEMLRTMARQRETDLATRRAANNRLLWLLISCAMGIGMLIIKETLLHGLIPHS